LTRSRTFYDGTRLRNQTTIAVITGGTQGLGLAIARRLALEGAPGIVISGRNAEKGEGAAKIVRALGSDRLFVKADVSLADDCYRSIETAAKEWLQIGDKHSGPRLIAIMSVIKTEGRLPGLGVYHIGRRNNPVPVSNLVVIAVIASVSIELVRNIIFNELLRIDRLAPISVDQVHRHSVVNSIIQEIIAPTINCERRVSEAD
jgi:NAD(P)-dependent dehydrogenase (short-subunit alcohol dehydrogenase family)